MDWEKVQILNCHTAVVGAGAAGLNAADELRRAGLDVLLLSDDLSGGTSRNAGSDKQTYYKLSLSGDSPDSVGRLARAFFAGGSIHGDHAYAMAALSARCFLKLVQLGVPFPHNEWGEFVGYQTDHDDAQRATSAGPLTSRYMAQALEKSARARGVRMRGGVMLAALLVDERGEMGGLMMLDLENPDRPYLLVNARNVVLCTGGAAYIYENTVFPGEQIGATGAALRAGATANNLCYWQYGLASLGVKWNVSGSYQQAVPCYMDENGEFLSPFFKDRADVFNSVFLKGYQWPFDARKIQGSSRVDLAVQAVRGRGGRTYMDFTREPRGGVLDSLGNEARRYLENCGAVQQTPIERLEAINAQAVAFYQSRGIDLHKQPLEIAVCAQHSNGGIRVDEWWRTDFKGLYAAGECAGIFGVYRPGGSALNETQVGSLRAAQHIIAHRKEEAMPEGEFRTRWARRIEQEISALQAMVDGKKSGALQENRRAMDRCAGVLRDVDAMVALKQSIERQLNHPGGARDLREAVLLRDTLHAQRAALSSMICQAGFQGEAGHGFVKAGLREPEGHGADYAFETREGHTRAVKVRPLPPGGGWFESVWKQYQAGKVFGTDGEPFPGK